MAIIIKFTDVGEYLNELEQNPPTDNVVRLTKSFHDLRNGMLKAVAVVSTYLDQGCRIVRLDRYCGEIWSTSTEDTPAKMVLDRANEIQEKIRCEAEKAGFDVRAGIYIEKD